MARCTVVATIAALCLSACGEEDEILLPAALPIDGRWEFDGIMSNLESDARCRFSGSMTVTQVGDFIDGTGQTVLTCDMFGTPRTYEAEGAIGFGATGPRGLSQNGNLVFSLGLCGMRGFHSDGLIEGTSGCPIPADPDDIPMIGFWRAVRAGTGGV